jgi:hypothetical protein
MKSASKKLKAFEPPSLTLANMMDRTFSMGSSVLLISVTSCLLDHVFSLVLGDAVIRLSVRFFDGRSSSSDAPLVVFLVTKHLFINA